MKFFILKIKHHSFVPVQRAGVVPPPNSRGRAGFLRFFSVTALSLSLLVFWESNHGVNTRPWLMREKELITITLTTIWGTSYSFYQVSVDLNALQNKSRVADTLHFR